MRTLFDANQLAPHRIRTFKLSNDPKFAEKLKDVVSLYVDPPDHPWGFRARNWRREKALLLRRFIELRISSSWSVSGRPSEHAVKIVIDGVKVLRGRVYRSHLDDEAVPDDPVAERFLSCVRPVPREMHGLPVARHDAGFLCRGKHRRQMIHCIGFNQLPEEIALRWRELSGRDPDLLSVRALAARIRRMLLSAVSARRARASGSARDRGTAGAPASPRPSVLRAQHAFRRSPDWDWRRTRTA